MKHIKKQLRAMAASRPVRVGGGIVLSGVFLYLALRNVDFRGVWETLSGANFLFVGLTLVNVAINTIAKGVRWQTLLGVGGRAIPLRTILSLHLVGQMLNKVVPARAGDFTRAYVVGGMGPGRVFALGTVVLEKLLDMISYLLLFFLLVILIPLPTWVSDSLFVLSAITFVALVFTIVLLYRRDWFFKIVGAITTWLPSHIQEAIQSRAQSGLSSLDILQRREDRFRLIGWSAFIWFTAVLNNVLTFLALGISLERPLVAGLLILVALQVGISLPAVPGNIGIFQYICVLVLGLFGVGETVAFSYGVLLHAIVMLPTTLIGVVLFWKMGVGVRQPAEELSGERV
jgi:glycosyltransferase 2 family protein